MSKKPKLANHHCRCGERACAEQSLGSARLKPAPAQAANERGQSLGREHEKEIELALKKRHAQYFKPDERLFVETELCHQFGRVGLKVDNPSRSTMLNVEVSVASESNQIDNPIEAYQRALDILDWVLLDYFESERISHFLPIWQSYDCEGTEAFVRLEHRNAALDDEATAFLLAHGYSEEGLAAEGSAEDGEGP